MKPTKIIIVVVLAGITLDVLVRVMMAERGGSGAVVQEKAVRAADAEWAVKESHPLPPPTLALAPQPLPVNERTNALENKPAEPTNSVRQTRARAQNMTWQPNQAPPLDKEAAYVVARVALSFVGADSDAEEYWMEAINDPTFSPKQREDLIEDLNEEGFADPRNPTREELPLIVNRILLIEDIAADAMDEVNAASFLEAYKDLVNMYVRLTR